MKPFCLLVFLALTTCAHAQTASRKGSFYFYWGYNRARFSTSDVTFKGENYAFTLYDAKAYDRPTQFGKVYFRPSTISIPQYNVRLGYFLTKRIAISIGMDHMKYVLAQNQSLVLSGVIDAQASAKYAGSYLYDTLSLSPDFVKFEHSDGLNLVSVDLEWLQPIKRHKKFALLLNGGIGGIWVATRTDSRIFNEGINNNFHISGFSAHAKLGPRLEIGRHFFCLFEWRGGMMSLPWIQLRNWDSISAEQQFFFLERYGAVGVRFRI